MDVSARSRLKALRRAAEWRNYRETSGQSAKKIQFDKLSAGQVTSRSLAGDNVDRATSQGLVECRPRRARAAYEGRMHRPPHPGAGLKRLYRARKGPYGKGVDRRVSGDVLRLSIRSRWCAPSGQVVRRAKARITWRNLHGKFGPRNKESKEGVRKKPPRAGPAAGASNFVTLCV